MYQSIVKVSIDIHVELPTPQGFSQTNKGQEANYFLLAMKESYLPSASVKFTFAPRCSRFLTSLVLLWKQAASSPTSISCAGIGMSVMSSDVADSRGKAASITKNQNRCFKIPAP